MTTGQMSVPSAPGRPAAGAPAVIEAVALIKTYGNYHALNAMNLRVPAGSVFGFLRLNGAGETTLLRVMSGLSRASSGSLRLLGEDATTSTPSIRDGISYLPDHPACEGAEALAGVLGQQDWAISVQSRPRGEEVRVSDTATAQREIPLPISRQDTGLIRMENAESGHEEVFLELVGKGNQ
ncbi:ABC-2 type transport system ATP-binding protein [Pseudarthrobacter sp. PvP004]|uniref:ATP-binding cassette domain-containing protein n=1 Tax=Pseudarthrobacter sp. PvP004 TaxID=2817850 RepID=UPI001AE73202|nr:ATP-binding cassette domain-containing protein [Pseudarthrobacter sp. PvP004]MBP2266114.1 ABC-2 type transport system ATP-binding protein [Pseudarthrobacter sp. PvP004]